jgi:hypothetical protein
MHVPWYDDVAAHFLSGMAIAFADRSFSGNAKRYTKERIENTLTQVASLQYLAESQKNLNSDVYNSKEYFNAVMKSREYFLNQGVYSKTPNHGGLLGLIEKTTEKFRNSRKIERVNNLSATQKLAFSLGAEFFGDVLVGISQITVGLGNGIAALGKSVYQTPALYLGLQTGRGMLYIKDLFRSKEEKDLDSMAKELTADGKLLERVRSYSPTASLPKTPETEKAQEKAEEKTGKEGMSIEKTIEGAGNVLADGAEKVYQGLGLGVNAIKDRIKKRMEEKAAEREKKDLRGKYDNY